MLEPRKASDLLASVLQTVQTKSARGVFQRAFERALTDVGVGTPDPESADSRCEVLGFRGGVLQVEVDSAPLYAELATFWAEPIRQAMNARLDDRAVAKVQFRMRGTGRA